jgi:hypothetical protein
MAMAHDRAQIAVFTNIEIPSSAQSVNRRISNAQPASVISEPAAT